MCYQKKCCYHVVIILTILPFIGSAPPAPTTTRNEPSSTRKNCSIAVDQLPAAANCSIELVNCLLIALPPSPAPHQLFPSTITTLLLSNNGLRSIATTSLNELRLLASLQITHNDLTELQRWSEHYFNALHLLHLYSNRIVTIARNALVPYPNVRTLRLDGNLINQLPDGLFANVSGLQRIDMSDNLLSTITAETFRGLDKLTLLLLGHNQIGSLDVAAFESNVALERLELDGNRLKSLVFSAPLTRLRHLNVSCNDISEVQGAAAAGGVGSDLNRLEMLDMSYNRLKQFHQGWAGSLKGLRVSFS